MIDEKKLIEKIEKMFVPLSTPDGRELIDIGINGYNECLIDVLETIKEQPKADQWISVEERLPEQSLNSVIGWDTYRECCVFVQYYMNEWILGNHESVNIVAWRPVPEPYEFHSKKLEKNSKGETE